ncbi:hypothetical protein ACFY0R_37845 [Streptomyces sp. NPDC001633]|uniref:hypothetical protein n=1 Tax=Streptomyces sp. NPDC001633 TaxID=3364595 RepID=UPI003681449D
MSLLALPSAHLDPGRMMGYFHSGAELYAELRRALGRLARRLRTHDTREGKRS